MNNQQLYTAIMKNVAKTVKRILNENTAQQNINAKAKEDMSAYNRSLNGYMWIFNKLNLRNNTNIKPIFGPKSVRAFFDPSVYYNMCVLILKHGGIANSANMVKLFQKINELYGSDEKVYRDIDDIDMVLPTAIFKGHMPSEWDNNVKKLLGSGRPAVDIAVNDDTELPAVIPAETVIKFLGSALSVKYSKNMPNFTNLINFIMDADTDIEFMRDSKTIYPIICADGSMLIIYPLESGINGYSADDNMAITRPDVAYRRSGTTATQHEKEMKGGRTREWFSYEDGTNGTLLELIRNDLWGFMKILEDYPPYVSFANKFIKVIRTYLEKQYDKCDEKEFRFRDSQLAKNLENYSYAVKLIDKITNGKIKFAIPENIYNRYIKYTGF